MQHERKPISLSDVKVFPIGASASVSASSSSSRGGIGGESQLHAHASSVGQLSLLAPPTAAGGVTRAVSVGLLEATSAANSASAPNLVCGGGRRTDGGPGPASALASASASMSTLAPFDSAARQRSNSLLSPPPVFPMEPLRVCSLFYGTYYAYAHDNTQQLLL